MQILQELDKSWYGWHKTERIAQLYNVSRRYMLTLLTKWLDQRLVKRMKAFNPNDYKIVDIWHTRPEMRYFDYEEKINKTERD